VIDVAPFRYNPSSLIPPTWGTAWNAPVAGFVDRTFGGLRVPWRVDSVLLGNAIDTWYGINAEDISLYGGNGSGPANWDGHYPAVRIPDVVNTYTMTQVAPVSTMGGLKEAASLVLLFDGLCDLAGPYGQPLNMSLKGQTTNVAISFRHNVNTSTNVLFCDGHATTIQASNIPYQFDSITHLTTNPVTSAPAYYPFAKWRGDQMDSDQP